ncbi:MAG: hypothetical protein JSW11_16725 [Candidatus Heimdallarchaeota archaeon]|nr:MAG: hypothetical protein JSW11_16725 [Candidatus Heimdallarchaeota archaeon]
MIIYAIFVITDDGRTILTEQFQSVEGIKDSILFGGVFTAIQYMTAAMTDSDAEINSIEIEGLSYHTRSFGSIRIVIVTDVPDSPENIIQTIGLRFIKKFGDVLTQRDFNLNVFEPFKKEIHEIVQEETVIDESRLIKPALKLRTAEIFSLPTRLQSTALALISLEKGTLKEIAQESGQKITEAEKNISILQNMGFVGMKEISGETTYFCSL